MPKAPVIPGLEISTLYEPVDSVGGDFYDFLVFPPGRVGLVMADVSGHGIDAALIMATAKKSLQLIARGNDSPRAVLIALANELRDDLPDSSFISVFYGILELRSGQLTYASAGHNPPLLLKGDQAIELTGGGTVISRKLTDHLERTLTQHTAELGRGDSLLLYTDGIVEAVDTNDEQFGPERLRQIAVELHDDGCHTLVAGIKACVDDHVDKRGMDDDVTLLAVRLGSMLATPEPPRTNSRLPRRLSNLPAPQTEFVGRAEPLARMQQWADAGQNVLVISGAAGTGKTELAHEFARRQLTRYPFGTWTVDLSRVREPAEAMAEILAALGGTMDTGAPPVRAVAEALKLRGGMLLILDGVLEPGPLLGDALPQWAAAQPEARFVITTRRSPRFLGTPEIMIGPMNFPDRASRRTAASEELKAFDAVALFLSLARQHDPEFAPSGDALRTVCHVVELLEGHPVSLQLAASRMPALGLSELENQLKSNTRKLAVLKDGGRKDTAYIVKGLEDAIEWSLGALQKWEREVLTQLCVFADGCFLESAQEVVALEAAAPPIVNIISMLVERGLMTRQPGVLGNRLRVPAPVREALLAGAAWADKPPVGDSPLRRFYRHMARLVFDTVQDLSGRKAAEHAERMRAEQGNIDYAVKLAEKAGDVDAAALLLAGAAEAMGHAGRAAEVARRLRAYLENLPEDRIKAQAEALIADTLAAACTWSGDQAGAAEALARSAKAAQRSRNRMLRAWVALHEAEHLLNCKQLDAAQERIDYAAFVYQRASDTTRMDMLNLTRGRLMLFRGLVPEAIELLRTSAEHLRRAGMRSHAHSALNLVGTALKAMGRAEEAIKLFQELLADMAGEERSSIEPMARHNYALALMRAGMLEEAMVVLDDAEEVVRLQGRVEGMAWLSTARAQLHLLMGDAEAAEGLMEYGLKVAHETGSASVKSSCYYIAIVTAAFARKWQRLLELVNELHAHAPAIPQSRMWADIPTLEILANTELGRHEKALPAPSELVPDSLGSVETPLRALACIVLARAHTARGDSKAAADHLKLAREHMKSGNVTTYDSDLIAQLAVELLDEIDRAEDEKLRAEGPVGALIRATDRVIRFGCACGAEYTVKRERGGKKTSCPRCRNVLIVPRA
ncbi:MAG: SpoIIE family protein phosphatase [Planctomycetes bacterium]|nr:SpoIIE family protein phosphatase [Planctomycetota bacterium]MCW8135593.1 SpoIIE family protein phosphatase [Planctomycetota bacterium]